MDSLVSLYLDIEMFTNMWSPYIVQQSDLSLQEEPLDLSVKTHEQSRTGPDVRIPEISFDFWKFYQTYQQISSHSL